MSGGGLSAHLRSEDDAVDARVQSLLDDGVARRNGEITLILDLTTRTVSASLRRLQKAGTVESDYNPPVKWGLTYSRKVAIAPSLEAKRRIVFEALLGAYEGSQWQIDSEWGSGDGAGIREEIEQWLADYTDPTPTHG